MDKAVPTFLGIGAARSGTSWLHRQLKQHPNVWLPPLKELHYFDRSPEYPSPNTLATTGRLKRAFGPQPWQSRRVLRGVLYIATNAWTRSARENSWWTRWYLGHYDDRWYRKLFTEGERFAACGEITPAYSILHGADVARIKAMNPEIRLIFLMRNPVQRAWSSMTYNAGRGKLVIDLECPDAVISHLETPGVLSRGDYQRTLDIYSQYFDSQQILVGFYDAIEHDPAGLISNITSFLGVPATDVDPGTMGQRINSSQTKASMPPQVREYLFDRYRPMIETLAARFGSYVSHWEQPDFDGAMRPGLPPTAHP